MKEYLEQRPEDESLLLAQDRVLAEVVQRLGHDQRAIELRNKIDLTHQASEIKIQNIEKELNTNLRELNKKIDHITQCIDKLFEITRK